MADADPLPTHRIPELLVRADPLLVIVVAAALFSLHETAAVCVPVLLSLLVAYALAPLVKRLEAWHVPRSVAAITVYVVLGFALTSVARGVRTQVAGVVDDLPRTMLDVKRVIDDGRRNGAGAPGVIDRLRQSVKEEQRVAVDKAPAPRGVRRVAVVPPQFDVRTYLVRGARGALDIGVGTIVVIVLSFLMLVAGDLFKRKIVKLAGHRFARRKITVDVLRAIDDQIERYLVVRLIISLLVAGGTALGLWAIGVHNPIVWGAIAGVLNVLPFAGPGLAIVLIAVAAFLQFKTIELTLAAGAIASFVAFVEGNVLTPWLASRACEINTVAVFVSVLFWGWLWGVWGLLLAVPIMVAIKAAADRVEPLQGIGELLGR